MGVFGVDVSQIISTTTEPIQLSSLLRPFNNRPQWCVCVVVLSKKYINFTKKARARPHTHIYLFGLPGNCNSFAKWTSKAVF